MSPRRAACSSTLQGLITERDLPSAEIEWPGLCAFLAELPDTERPPTFLELVWRFECWRARFVSAT